MSMPVTAGEVAARLEEYGTSAFLVTVGDDGSPKVVHLALVWEGNSGGGSFRCTPGGGTLRNLAESGPVTLVFPPAEPGGYSMLIDGTGRVAGASDELPGTDDLVRIDFGGGVLHRPAPDASDDQVHC
ncbi:MAG: pyridoxamine 5'-phosphate oxidase family protein [Acidimicrobiales bacterium]|nr:pyridoxamine 5'-phosphate oxidase family protein [Acidimicrobiales bacterium]